MSDDTKKLLAAAKAGKLDKILALAGFDLEGTAKDGVTSDDEDAAALTAFKWFLIAGDLGHEIADDLDMLRTGTALHYDEDQSVEASIYFALGVDYLRGEGGVAANHAHAASHFAQAKELGVAKAKELVKQFDRIRGQLTAEELAVFDGVFAKGKAAKGKAATKAKAPAAKTAAAKAAKPAAKATKAKAPAAKPDAKPAKKASASKPSAAKATKRAQAKAPAAKATKPTKKAVSKAKPAKKSAR